MKAMGASNSAMFILTFWVGVGVWAIFSIGLGHRWVQRAKGTRMDGWVACYVFDVLALPIPGF